MCAALALGGAAVAEAPRISGAERPPFRYETMGVANGCFVESVACYDAYHEKFGEGGWVRVLQWGAKEDEVMVAGHAVAVFETAGVLWCWDVNFGWTPLSIALSERENAALVAAPIVAKYPRVTALYPILWDGGIQVPDAGPQGAAAATEAEGAQYARIVATRLARHRPVNLVEFTQSGDGEPRTREAVVFVFGHDALSRAQFGVERPPHPGNGAQTLPRSGADSVHRAAVARVVITARAKTLGRPAGQDFVTRARSAARSSWFLQ